ncbi:MAG: SH3 domain-containing protein, partial [Anaerolineae bacterium]|nr:SH3 domain-containing protein [Anaerolineae bacterium]
MQLKKFLWLLSVLFISTTISIAQEMNCPVMVETIIDTVDDSCAGLGLNEACYGNQLVDAQDFNEEPVSDFQNSGDTVGITTISSLSTADFDVTNDTWGIALLSLQADLPDTLPGQSVTIVVFGDAQLRNQVIPEDQLVSTLPATSTGAINVRGGAGTNFEIVRTLANGEVITLIGRNAAGDWVQIESDAGEAWVFASLLTIDGDLARLPISGESANSEYTAPMQAFQLQTGIGQPACAEVPPSGILVQAPTETTVHFLVNGVQVEVGSTAFLQTNNTAVTVNTLDGMVTVTSAGETQAVEPGYQVTASADRAPTEPDDYDFDALRYLPVSLLPERIGIPVLVRANNTWRDTGIAVDAGDTFILRTGGIINFWDFCETQKVANGQPDIDCNSLLLGPAGGDPLTLTGEVLGSDMTLFPVFDAPPHSLVARIGSSTFFVGEGGEFTAPESGTLEFRP